MSIFKGAASAIITPFNEDTTVNFDEFAKIIDFQINAGLDAIVVCGTTGESAILNTVDHIETIRFVTEYVNKRVPVIAGVGSNNTQYAIDMIEKVNDFGIDGALVVTPYYNKATQGGLYEHYKAIGNASKAPVIVYNVPSRTGTNIKPQTVAKLVKDVPNITSIKEASGNISQVLEVMEYTDGKIDIYSGNDDQIVPVLSVGGKGVISVLANVAPKETHDICYKFFDGDTKGALDLQIKYNGLIRALFSEVNPIPVKRAVELMGFNTGNVVLPLTHITPENEEILKNEMKKVGLL